MKPIRIAVLLATIFLIVCSFRELKAAALQQPSVDSLTADTVASPAQVRMLLESSNPREQAWGAWLAGTGKMTDMIPLIEHVASERQNTAGETLDVVMDALIQLDASPAPDWLMTVYPRYREQVLILLSRSGTDSDGALLKLAGQENFFAWFAVANPLLRNRAPGFAALLLRYTHISVNVVVVDPGRSMGAGQSFRDGGCGRGVVKPDIGFPPLPVYTLVHSSQPGAVLLSSGPKSVAYMREVLVVGGPPNPTARCVFDPGPTSADLLAYLTALAPKIAMTVSADEHHMLEWHGSDALAASIEGFRDDIRKRYEPMLRQLTVEGLLTPDEASTLKSPNIDVQVRDFHTVSSPK